MVVKPGLDRFGTLRLGDMSLVGETIDCAGAETLMFGGGRFEDCTFINMRPAGGTLGRYRQQSQYLRCRFVKPRATGLRPTDSRFEDCVFEEVNLRDWMSREAEYVRCTFSGRFRQAVFAATFDDLDDLTGRRVNEVVDNDFTQCQFVDVGFRGGVDLTLQRLPMLPGHCYVPDLDALVEALSVVAAEEGVSSLVPTLKFLRREYDWGQRQFFGEVGLFGPQAPLVARVIRDLGGWVY